MTELLLSTKKLYKIRYYMKKDIVFSISFVLAIFSSAIKTPKLGYIDFKVLVCLFNLMVVIKAFENIKLLDKFAVGLLNRCSNNKTISLVLILLAFFMSMLVTNDIALITLVPITLIIAEKTKLDMLGAIILETLAANIGSSLTPMGNPQNLYIFTHYRLSTMMFFKTSIIFSLTGLIWLFFLNRRGKKKKIDLELKCVRIVHKKETIVWIMLFIVIILSVFNVIGYSLAMALTVAVVLIVDRRLLFQIDYLLLLTFVCFFIFIGNVSSMSQISRIMQSILKNGQSAFFGAIVLSQFISNVPCSIFLSRFTPCWRPLLLGVNIGGMGTLIASLASVISYKYYVRSNTKASKRFIIKFSKYNFISLAVFTGICYLFMVV